MNTATLAASLTRPINAFKAYFAPPVPLPAPGLHLLPYPQASHTARLHLRVHEDGSGVLLVNANRILHLNPSAVAMSYYFLQGVNTGLALRTLGIHFDLDASQASQDYAQFTADLLAFLTTEQGCPTCTLGAEIIAPFSAPPAAPYRMDLAITYRCNNDCSHCYNVSDRQDDELDTAAWQSIIDRLWQTGIPHIVFTGGEATLREDLPDLIRYASQRGFIVGLNTNGRRMSDPTYTQSLVDAGLEHVQITLESLNPVTHDLMMRRQGAWKQTIRGIQNALKTRLFVMTNTTMLQTNLAEIPATLAFLAETGVPTIGLNALIHAGRGKHVNTGIPESELTGLLSMAQDFTNNSGQRLIWYTPTRYCAFDPVQLDLGVKGCTAALYNMCIEPDGGVLPCQSYYRQVGNLLSGDWAAIWNHPLCLALRNRSYAPQACRSCSLLTECGAGCPLQLAENESGDAILRLEDIL